MKRYLVALAVAFMAMLVPEKAPAQSSLFNPATQIRTTAVLTSSDVLGTTFSIPADVKAVHYYINFTKGSLTDATFAPAGAMDGNPAAAGYYKTNAKAVTLSANAKVHIRVAREDIGAYRYGGIFTIGNGTATSSDALIYYKFEQ